MKQLPATYDVEFDAMLAAVAAVTPPEVPLVPFWPLRGSTYGGDLLVIGRSVNGWIEDWTAGNLGHPSIRRKAVARMREDADRSGSDPMAWVTDLWGATKGYNTRRSAFWRVLADLTAGFQDRNWPSRLVWTNLYKVSPAAGWNPGADLQRAQRVAATALLNLELETFEPRRVLAMTGDWIAPFADELGLGLSWQDGLVVGTAMRRGVPWVIARHPMKKPQAPFVAEVCAAFAQLGAPLR